MIKKITILFIVALLSFLCAEVGALEQKIEDLSASVEVASVFDLSLTNSNIAFGLIKPGDTKILGEGNSFNEVKCRSNLERPWYLKANLVSLGLLGKGQILPASCLKWKIVECSSSLNSLSKLEFQDFSKEPVLIYNSAGDDNRGKEVILKFQYRFSSPEDAPAGNYLGQIIFTMAESP